MFIKPMLLQTADEVFDDERYIYEPKSNGVRLLLSSHNGEKRLYTRHGTELTGRIPEIENIDLPNVYLDGELVCYRRFDNTKNNVLLEDFEATMKRVNSKKESSIIKGSKTFPLTYIVFDILEHNQTDITNYQLIDRKDLLNEVISDSDTIRKTFYVDGFGTELFKDIQAHDGEGLVAKFKNSTYQIGKRSYDFLKIINWRYDICYIYGFKKNKIGWLIATKENENFKPAGIVEFGMNQTHKTAFYQIANELITGENKYYYTL